MRTTRNLYNAFLKFYFTTTNKKLNYLMDNNYPATSCKIQHLKSIKLLNIDFKIVNFNIINH